MSLGDHLRNSDRSADGIHQSPDIVLAALQTIQEVEESVSRPITPWPTVRWGCLRKGSLLHCEGRIEVNLRGLHRFMAYPDIASRQDMEKEPSDELVRLERHGLLTLIICIIPP